MKDKKADEQTFHELEEENTMISDWENSTAVRVAVNAEKFTSNYDAITEAMKMFAETVEPYHDLLTKNVAATATTAAATIANAMSDFDKAGLLAALEAATETPEILELQAQLKNSTLATATGLSAVSDYVSDLTAQWNEALLSTEVEERSIAAQNFAMIRMLPDYSKLELPRGSKTLLKSLTKATAEKLTQTQDILFDPKERKFYHKNSPERKLTANQITVVESSQDLFADISLDELVSFESQLYEDTTFALDHPVGKKIFNIIKEWNTFINFDCDTYYHARRIEDGQAPFLDQEMLKAPLNISSHGRYNAIGKSCYYVAETRDGAVTEIAKHSGGKKVNIQIVGLRPIKTAKIIDLSGEIKGTNRFIEHLRFTIENDEGKKVKSYLLPNFVASCCKRIGIEGIKYRSSGYNCCVLWKDDYFEFIEGSREITSSENHRD